MKIVWIVPDAFSMWRFWGDIAARQVAEGHDVHLVSSAAERYAGLLIDKGVKFHEAPIRRFIAPIDDLKLICVLCRLLKQISPDVVHCATIKPNIFGTIAAALAGVPRRIIMLVGLGHAFAPAKGLRRALVRLITVSLYRLAILCSHRVCVVNSDDFARLNRDRFAKAPKLILIKSGIPVDGSEFRPNRLSLRAREALIQQLGLPPGSVVILMVVARLIWSKGVAELLAAARLLEKAAPEARFILVGPFETENPDAIPCSYLTDLPANMVRMDFTEDLADLTALADIVTLPSYYPEGLPVVLLEGMAAGKAIVTTDNVGCREAVREGENGFLIPIRDAEALADRISRLVKDPALCKRMGVNSREFFEANFTLPIIYDQLMGKLYAGTTASD